MIKKLTLTLFLLSCALDAQDTQLANWILENIPEVPQRIVDRQNQYNNTRNARLLGWLPDENGMLITTRFGQQYQIHNVSSPGGSRKQLTFFEKDGASNALIRPKHNGFLMRLDASDGGEKYQLVYYDLTTRTSQTLTDGKSNHLNSVWSPDGMYLAYSSPKHNSKENELFIYDTNQKKELYFPLGEGAWYALDWNEKDELLLVNQIGRQFAIHTFKWKTKTQQHHKVNNQSKIDLNSAMFDRTDNGLYIVTNAINGTKSIYHYNTKTGKLVNITKNIDEPVDNFWLSQDRNLLLFSTERNGQNPIYQIHTEDFSIKELENIPKGLIYGLHITADNSKIGFVLNNATTQGDIFEYNLSSEMVTRWSYSEVGGLNTENFSEGTFFTYPTFDKVDGNLRQIPAFIYKPKTKKGPFPVLINIHGGPQMQHLPYFSSNTQFMTSELGIAVIGPNVRGSSGYGEEFLNLDNGFNREDAVKDIGKLLDWIETQPDLDASRIAVYGGSYGGYMTLASLVHFNDRIKCGIDLVGVSDWVTFLENTTESGKNRRRAEYGDERKPEVRAFLKEISPLTNAHKITKPLLVAQGLNDARVPAAQSEMMVEKIRKNGGDVWYMLAKDEGHSFRKRENIAYFRLVLALFLETYLLN